MRWDFQWHFCDLISLSWKNMNPEYIARPILNCTSTYHLLNGRVVIITRCIRTCAGTTINHDNEFISSSGHVFSGGGGEALPRAGHSQALWGAGLWCRSGRVRWSPVERTGGDPWLSRDHLDHEGYAYTSGIDQTSVNYTLGQLKWVLVRSLVGFQC